MLSFSHEALPEGCDRARDPFLLGRLKAPAAGADTFAARARSALPSDQLDLPVVRQ